MSDLGINFKNPYLACPDGLTVEAWLASNFLHSPISTDAYPPGGSPAASGTTSGGSCTLTGLSAGAYQVSIIDESDKPTFFYVPAAYIGGGTFTARYTPDPVATATPPLKSYIACGGNGGTVPGSGVFGTPTTWTQFAGHGTDIVLDADTHTFHLLTPGVYDVEVYWNMDGGSSVPSMNTLRINDGNLLPYSDYDQAVGANQKYILFHYVIPWENDPLNPNDRIYTWAQFNDGITPTDFTLSSGAIYITKLL